MKRGAEKVELGYKTHPHANWYGREFVLPE